MKILYIVYFLNIIACFQNEVIANPPVVTDYNNCSPACANLIRLQCKESTPIKSNKKCNHDNECDKSENCDLHSNICVTTCENFCIQTEKIGVWLNPSCIIHINKCEDIENVCNK